MIILKEDDQFSMFQIEIGGQTFVMLYDDETMINIYDITNINIEDILYKVKKDIDKYLRTRNFR